MSADFICNYKRIKVNSKEEIFYQTMPKSDQV